MSAESQAFEWLAGKIEADTSLSRLQARGTVRLALKKCGLQPTEITAAELVVVLQRLLSNELERRGVEDAAGFCDSWTSQLAEEEPNFIGLKNDTPTELLRRILQSKL